MFGKLHLEMAFMKVMAKKKSAHQSSFENSILGALIFLFFFHDFENAVKPRLKALDSRTRIYRSIALAQNFDHTEIYSSMEHVLNRSKPPHIKPLQ